MCVCVQEVQVASTFQIHNLFNFITHYKYTQLLYSGKFFKGFIFKNGHAFLKMFI